MLNKEQMQWCLDEIAGGTRPNGEGTCQCDGGAHKGSHSKLSTCINWIDWGAPRNLERRVGQFWLDEIVSAVITDPTENDSQIERRRTET